VARNNLLEGVPKQTGKRSYPSPEKEDTSRAGIGNEAYPQSLCMRTWGNLLPLEQHDCPSDGLKQLGNSTQTRNPAPQERAQVMGGRTVWHSTRATNSLRRVRVSSTVMASLVHEAMGSARAAERAGTAAKERRAMTERIVDVDKSNELGAKGEG